MLDLLLVGGDVVDGTGRRRHRANVGVQDGRFVEVGLSGESARRTVNVDGLVVSPGFIDVHTHFDAQAFWDPYLTPSSLFGVTTVIGGNCGFSIAPLSEDSADYLMRMLARVEGMPLESLAQGVPWDWHSTEDYLGRLAGRLGVNAGFMVGHSAIRRLVMGTDAVERPATPTELAAMCAVLRDGLKAGGLGFSSSWGQSHQDGAGTPVPSRHAAKEELLSLAAVCSEFVGTSVEFIPATAPCLDDPSKELMAVMSRAALRPLNWNVMRVGADNLDDCYSDLQAGTYASEIGGRVVALTMPVQARGRFSFRTAFALDGLPDWGPTMRLPAEERRRALSDPNTRRMLAKGAQKATGGMRQIVDWSSKVIAEGFSEDTKRYEGRVIGDIATEEGKDPFDTLLDIVCSDDLYATFSNKQTPLTSADWAAAAQIWRDGRAVIGASDAGAHLDFTGNFDYAVHVLERAVREHGVVSLEEAIHLMTDVPARLYGLRQRGRIAPDYAADLFVFDETSVGPQALETRFDLPGGAGRLYSEPRGIAYVYVNGRLIVDHGRLTGELPGDIVRSGHDSATPSLAVGA